MSKNNILNWHEHENRKTFKLLDCLSHLVVVVEAIKLIKMLTLMCLSKEIASDLSFPSAAYAVSNLSVEGSGFDSFGCCVVKDARFMRHWEKLMMILILM